MPKAYWNLFENPFQLHNYDKMLSALTEWGVSIHYVCRKLGKIWKLAEGIFGVTYYREKKLEIFKWEEINQLISVAHF